jgi:hypothetical protein
MGKTKETIEELVDPAVEACKQNVRKGFAIYGGDKEIAKKLAAEFSRKTGGGYPIVVLTNEEYEKNKKRGNFRDFYELEMDKFAVQ